MANVFEYASVFQSELDKAAVEQATSGWMELNDKLVRYNGGAEVKIPSMDMDGLADYDRDKGFVEGSVNLKWETKEMTQDRGRQFTFDENEVNETNFVVTAAQVMGEFQRTKVIPEIDAYENIPCALSSPSGGKLGKKEPTASIDTDFLLFVRPEVEIEPGDTVKVIRLGREYLTEAGLADRQPSHNNVPLKLAKAKA